MDIQAIMELIGTVGFPVAMCLTMFWYMTKQTEAHKQEIDKMTEALNNNTIALTKLQMKIGVDTDE